MKCGDIMTQEVISIAPEASVREAAQLMVRERISALPVINAEHVLVGIVSEGDLLRRAETGTEKHRPRWLEFLIEPAVLSIEYVRSHSQVVGDVMTTRLVTVDEDTPLTKAVDLMERMRVKRLPVMRGHQVVGIISRSNLLQALASLPAPQAKSTTDAVTEANVREALKKLTWLPADCKVIAYDGVVDLWGTVFDERERSALRVAAENVPGVKKVRDHLAWVDRTSGVVLETGLGHESWPVERQLHH